MQAFLALYAPMLELLPFNWWTWESTLLKSTFCLSRALNRSLRSFSESSKKRDTTSTTNQGCSHFIVAEVAWTDHPRTPHETRMLHTPQTFSTSEPPPCFGLCMCLCLCLLPTLSLYLRSPFLQNHKITAPAICSPFLPFMSSYLPSYSSLSLSHSLTHSLWPSWNTHHPKHTNRNIEI